MKSIIGSIIDLRSFEPRYHSALIFSLFEGLTVGGGYRLILKEDPSEITNLFREASIANVKFHIEETDDNAWTIEIAKTDQVI